MNLKLQDEAAFFAEYQNQPLPAETVVDGMLKPEEVSMKINRMDRGLVSIGANHLRLHRRPAEVALLCSHRWEDDFTGYVIDYGCYPDQQRPYFTLREARQTLSSEATGTGLEGSIYAGLESLTSKLLDREWQRDDGAAMRIGRCLIDANWANRQMWSQFCRQSKHAAVIIPSHGRFVGASSLPFSEYRRRPGDRVGLNWRIPTFMASAQSVTWSTIPTGGSRLSMLAFVSLWAIAAACRSSAQTPKRIVCLPSI